MTTIHKHAHDSGDGQTIYHCPFCGSGQVIARSDRTIECEFCHVAFTVQVQPMYPAFPQTIDGQPVQVPGMPGQVSPPDAIGEDPTMVSPDDVGEDGEAAPPFGQDPEGGDGEAEGDSGDDDSDEGDGGNPFAKKSYRTARGDWLSEDEFVNHLMIEMAPPEAKRSMAALVKASRKQ